MNGPGESLSGAILRRLFEWPLENGYRPGMSQHETTWWMRLVSVAAIAALTMVAVWAALDLQDARSEGVSPTQELRDQVTARIEIQDALALDVSEKHETLASLQESILPLDEQEMEYSDQLRMATGALAVSGPGITISLDDSGAVLEEERVTDFDLQVVVNALWAAGAEAISINEQRLSASTAIRSAGSAILVNLTPLNPPYTISAIGDPIDLQVELSRTRAAGHLAVLRNTYGLSVATETHDELILPSAPETNLRFAEIDEV